MTLVFMCDCGCEMYNGMRFCGYEILCGYRTIANAVVLAITNR